VFAIGHKHHVETGQVRPRLVHQGCQPGDETQWFEDDVRPAIPVRRLQLVANDSSDAWQCLQPRETKGMDYDVTELAEGRYCGEGSDCC